jgi:hypothetical protein
MFIDNEAGSVERVCEDLVEKEVPGTRFGLVCHENEHRVRRPLLKFHLGNAGAHSPDIPAECCGKHILAGPIEFHTLGNFRAFQKDIPRKPVDLFIVYAMGMGHDQFEIIAAVRDKGIDQEFTLFILEQFVRLLEELGVGAGVSGKTAHIRLNHRNGGLGHRISQYEIAP